MKRNAILLGILIIGLGFDFARAEKRCLTVEDAVRTGRIARDFLHHEVAISPDGSRVAFIVVAPKVEANKNNYELRVRSLKSVGAYDNGRLLFHANHLGALQWLGRGEQLAVLSRENGVGTEEDRLNIINARTGRREVIQAPTKRIRSFSADQRGDRIVVSVGVPESEDLAINESKKRYGFRVSPGTPIVDPSLVQEWFPNSMLYLIEPQKQSRTKMMRLRPRGPFGEASGLFRGDLTDLSLSPDGRSLVFRYETKNVPAEWKDSFYAKQFQSSAFPLPLWGLLDLKDGGFRIAFDAPAYTYMRASWSDDSQSFAISAMPPEGSSWQKQDFAAGFSQVTQMDSYTHLFTIDRESGAISEVLPRYKGLENGRISWSRNDGPMWVPLERGVLAKFERRLGSWKEVSRSTIFSDTRATLESISASDNVAVGVKEDIRTPPNLAAENLDTGKEEMLTDLNPQYREIELGSIERIDWLNKYGVKCWGYLIKPVGYLPDKTYPLVIMNKPREGFFVSDGSYTTAFPPQVLAGVGFTVLMVQYAVDFGDLPNGLPGRLAEAMNFTATVESAASYLVNRGIADRTRVGIIGFSRTSWKTDFTLTHSDFKFAAASSADSGLYNYGVYWLENDHAWMTEEEQMMGGPPYGQTLENWLKYSPAFNAQRVHCPLLMEYTGYGRQPYGPTNAYEFFTALYRQARPVELYFYPLGAHPLDTPSERVASLRRNVEWFQFWMQGHEDVPPPYDRDQYVRWRELRRTGGVIEHTDASAQPGLSGHSK